MKGLDFTSLLQTRKNGFSGGAGTCRTARWKRPWSSPIELGKTRYESGGHLVLMQQRPVRGVLRLNFASPEHQAESKGEGGAMATQNKRMALVCAGLVVSSALVAAAAQAQGVSFEEAREFVVGRSPWPVAVGDFNGDGVLDLAVPYTDAYPRVGGVAVLLGKGDGSFQAAQNFAAGNVGAGSYASSVLVMDFKGV